jgi:hypothetical protein
VVERAADLPLGRLGHRGAPLMKRLAEFGIAGQSDNDQQERLEHQANPTMRR